VLPATPDTDDLAALFPLLFDVDDGAWLAAMDDHLLARVLELAAPPAPAGRSAVLHAITMLGSAVRDAGYAPLLRRRMDPALLHDEPFRQLARAVDDACREAAEGDTPAARVLAPQRLPEVRALLAELLRVQRERHGVRALLARHHSMLARQVAERNAETGEHYIARTRQEYGDMVRRALGGGAVIAGTTFLKFAIATLGLSAFWVGFAAGINYAASFVVVMLLHWTVATKQPAMTAPALAASLPAGRDASDTEIEGFIDRVAQLIRSQAAGIVGNLALCGPIVLAVQALAMAVGATPLVGPQEAAYVLTSLTLLGPTLAYAAFTGVLLFASSLIAGWAENWFVFHRLDSAIAWNPRIVARLGAPRAQRWARWWRTHVSGLAANVSLGLLLGLVPALAAFVALPLDVRHVTLATGQLAAAAAALGWEVLGLGAFWWCVAAIPFIGLLNVAVSFACAFHVALRSRGTRVQERERLYAAIRGRLRREPLSCVWPPRDATAPS
jgi:site-specific recombinase